MKETIMRQLVRIGMDTSKKVFQLHGVDAEERVALGSGPIDFCREF
ncbi:hypothetical protein [Novacetimonas hansenii]|uniref:Transposase n=1 Tax=Novacetimonas hansenii TaxID=436 RepID=A0AAW5ENT4_NOVHA|nr:hypothetical protein [Novacetimonas hansenii]MCJ8352851.1 hypothetical protein [Novacetimonas hansenii]